MPSFYETCGPLSPQSPSRSSSVSSASTGTSHGTVTQQPQPCRCSRFNDDDLHEKLSLILASCERQERDTAELKASCARQVEETAELKDKVDRIMALLGRIDEKLDDRLSVSGGLYGAVRW